jgi:dissimilatory sulfite reductase (desulfoviridin) alpha/beta subunit
MPTDIGPPDYKTMLPPVIQRNYGKWRYHEILKPGVMMHVGETGEALYTVRAGSPRLLSTDHIREISPRSTATATCASRAATTSSFSLRTRRK